MPDSIIRTEIYHKDYNLDKKDNLDTLPEEPAVYGFFGIIQEKPVNCRFAGETANLRKGVRERFEQLQPEDGLKKFMQGPWIKMLCYQPCAGTSEQERQQILSEWRGRYDPKVDDEGEYPRNNSLD